MSDENILNLSDENKSMIRNYAMVAGFFTLFVMFTLMAVNMLSDKDAGPMGSMTMVFEIGIVVLLLSGVIIALLHKRDQIAIAFIFLSFALFVEVVKTLLLGPMPGPTPDQVLDPELVTDVSQDVPPIIDMAVSTITAPVLMMLVLFGIMMLITRNEQKYITAAVILPFAVLGFVGGFALNAGAIWGIYVVAVGLIIPALVSLYAAFVLGIDNPRMPGYAKLTVDEECESNDGSPVHFKVTGAVLGYSIFALPMLAYAIHYLDADGLTIDACATLESYCGILLILTGILMLVAGRMRFTPFLFVMLGMVTALSGYLGPNGWISLIFFLAIALIVLIRSDRRILVGVAIIIYALTFVFTDLTSIVSVPAVSFILNLVPFVILVYVCFALCSDGRLKLC